MCVSTEIREKISLFSLVWIKLIGLLDNGNIRLLDSSTHNLRVMIIDDSGDRNQSLSTILNDIDCDVVACISTRDDMLSQIEQHQPEMVIFDIEMPDRDILENLRNAQSALPRPMVMFSQDDNGERIRHAVNAGVNAYVVDGIEVQRIRPIIDAAIATFDQFQLLQKQLDVTQRELNRNKQMDRAKRILMKQRSIGEDEAYRFMRKSAMDRKQKIEDIAQQITDAAELIGLAK